MKLSIASVEMTDLWVGIGKRMRERSERAEELFEEVGGYGGAVFGGAADVVDGEGFGGEGGAGGGDGCRG